VSKCRFGGNEYRGLEGGKRGLETKVRVLEELKEKVVSLEAEVEVGRWECEAW